MVLDTCLLIRRSVQLVYIVIICTVALELYYTMVSGVRCVSLFSLSTSASQVPAFMSVMEITMNVDWVNNAAEDST